MVVDGDTLNLDGQRIRLFGVDAPELRQECRLPSGPWKCGQAAKDALASFLGGRTPDCQQINRDRYRRAVSVCWVAGVDIGGWMVSNGWAVAETRYSLNYVAAESAARSTHKGIWQSEFQRPDQWRSQRQH